MARKHEAPAVAESLFCAKCGSEWLVRSRRHWWERALPFLKNLRPYRCHGCGARRWLRVAKHAGSDNVGPETPSLLFR